MENNGEGGQFFTRDDYNQKDSEYVNEHDVYDGWIMNYTDGDCEKARSAAIALVYNG